MPRLFNLYFIAIVSPPEISDEITKFKQDFAERFESKKALHVLPHITLKAPFKFSAEKHKELLRWFAQTYISVKPFEQELKDFACFDNKRNPVIFIHPILSKSLQLLQKQILQHFKKSFPEQPIPKNEFEYSPHLTVAYRDLKPPMFQEAWKEYQLKNYSAKFKVSEFHLLQHDGKRWNIVHTYQL